MNYKIHPFIIIIGIISHAGADKNSLLIGAYSNSIQEINFGIKLGYSRRILDDYDIRLSPELEGFTSHGSNALDANNYPAVKEVFDLYGGSVNIPVSVHFKFHERIGLNANLGLRGIIFLDETGSLRSGQTIDSLPAQTLYINLLNPYIEFGIRYILESISLGTSIRYTKLIYEGRHLDVLNALSIFLLKEF